MRTATRALLLFAVAAGLQACSDETVVRKAWIRLPAVEGRPAAAYFEIQTGLGRSSRLEKIEGPFKKAELHESVEKAGRSAMRPLPHVELPSGERVRFEPGGKHAMLFSLHRAVRAGDTVQLQFYENAGFSGSMALPPVEAVVVGPADESPYKRGFLG